MRPEEKIKQLEQRVTDLERRLDIMEGKKKVEHPERGDPARRLLSVNKIAFEKIFDAWARNEPGSRKAMKEYCRYYRIPT